MASEWRKLRVEEFAAVVGGGTPSTKDPANFNGEIPWITPKDLSGYSFRYISRGERNITQQGLANSNAKILPAGSVLLTTRAPVGYVAIAANSLTTNQGFHSLVPREGFSSEFIYYLLKANTEYLKTNASGTTFGELSGQVLKKLIFSNPPLPEQRAIAYILGTLDDKIETNRKMSRVLEEMARALFKAWFVDFEPVRAKCMGDRSVAPTAWPQHILDLFPDRLVDSELGEIPEGWEVVTLGELMELAYGKALKDADRKPGRIPVYGSNGVIGWHSEPLTGGPGIIVGRKGNPGTVTWAATDFFAIDTTFYVVPKSESISLYLLFYALRQHNLPSLSADSAVPGLNRNFVYANKQLLPPSKVIEAFDNIIKPTFDRIHQNETESRTLAALRDALLPKLIRGEIRVRDAERFLKERGL